MSISTAPMAGPVERRLVPSGADPLPGHLDGWLAARGPELVAVRRHLHAHPEPSHQEFETAALVARELEAAGLQPRLLPRGNGVLCEVGEGDRVIALRADLDALPVADLKDVDYRSTVPGLAHACGHDVHTTVLLGVGLALAELAGRGALPGRVRLLFQPAEESPTSGAPEMISAGGLKDAVAAFGVHCAPHLPVGVAGVRSGQAAAAADRVEVALTGPGGHTARPHLTVDLVHALGRVIVNVPSLLHRRTDPRAGISLMWGTGQAGHVYNAIPVEGRLSGSVHILNREAWSEAPELVTSLIREVAAATGARAEVRYQRGVPPVVNDRGAAHAATAAAVSALGPDRVVEDQVNLAGNGFGYYLEHVPGALIQLGTAGPGPAVDVHRGDFDVDERAIEAGVRLMLHTVLAWFADDHAEVGRRPQ